MQGKIALEEHFAIPDTLSDSKGFLPDHTWMELRGCSTCTRRGSA